MERRGVPWCIVKFRGAIGLKGYLKKEKKKNIYSFFSDDKLKFKCGHEVRVKILSWYLVDEGHNIFIFLKK